MDPTVWIFDPVEVDVSDTCPFIISVTVTFGFL